MGRRLALSDPRRAGDARREGVVESSSPRPAAQGHPGPLKARSLNAAIADAEAGSAIGGINSDRRAFPAARPRRRGAPSATRGRWHRCAERRPRLGAGRHLAQLRRQAPAGGVPDGRRPPASARRRGPKQIGYLFRHVEPWGPAPPDRFTLNPARPTEPHTFLETPTPARCADPAARGRARADGAGISPPTKGAGGQLAASTDFIAR